MTAGRGSCRSSGSTRVMIGGMWMPELIALAGGTALVTKPGDHAPTLTREALAALSPDVVLVKPCGFPLERTLDELETLRDALPWNEWAAVRAGQRVRRRRQRVLQSPGAAAGRVARDPRGLRPPRGVSRLSRASTAAAWCGSSPTCAASRGEPPDRPRCQISMRRGPLPTLTGRDHSSGSGTRPIRSRRRRSRPSAM